MRLTIFAVYATCLGLLLSCGGVEPPPLDCRTLGCDAGSTCVEFEEGKWRCEPDVDPCEGVECSSPWEECQEGVCVRDPNAPPDDRRLCNQPPDYPKTGCWNKPPGGEWHWIPAKPVCPEECPEGQHCTDPAIGCVPKPPPPGGDCPFATPTAAWMEANGFSCEVKPMREGRKGIGATPRCKNWPDVNGEPYYCQDGLWPEACAAGRRGGPVAPDGHPARVACEQQFLELPCPMFTYSSETHMSFDPWVTINSVNQNHPRNVAVCGQGQFESHESWEKCGTRYICMGQWSWATAHGNGIIHASAKDGKARGSLNYVER